LNKILVSSVKKAKKLREKAIEALKSGKFIRVCLVAKKVVFANSD
jgi:hypothetical protein